MRLTRFLVWVLPIVLFCSTASFASQFNLAWDPNCDVDPTLSGYNLYYKTSSILATGLAGATRVEIGVDQTGFNRLDPGYSLNLPNDTRFYFVVTAMYGPEEESNLSNEINGINGSGQTQSSAQHPTRLRAVD